MLSGIEIFFFVVVVLSEHLNLFVLATEHTLLRMFLNIWHQILFPGDLHDGALCTTERRTFIRNCPPGRLLPAHFST